MSLKWYHLDLISLFVSFSSWRASNKNKAPFSTSQQLHPTTAERGRDAQCRQQPQRGAQRPGGLYQRSSCQETTLAYRRGHDQETQRNRGEEGALSNNCSWPVMQSESCNVALFFAAGGVQWWLHI